MAKRRKDRPVADRAADAKEDLGAGAPTVQRLAHADDDDVAIAALAGVRAAGESNRPAGTHAAPEHDTDDVPAEFDVDSIQSLDGDYEEPGPGQRLDDLSERPEDPRPFRPA
jgi:hypothetical protein